jgi:hypothetical protein
MYHYVRVASSGFHKLAGNPTQGHPIPGNSAGGLTTLWVPPLSRRSSDFHLPRSRMSLDSAPGFIPASSPRCTMDDDL